MYPINHDWLLNKLRIHHFENMFKFKLIMYLNTNKEGITKLRNVNYKLKITPANHYKEVAYLAGSQERDLSRGGGERLQYQQQKYTQNGASMCIRSHINTILTNHAKEIIHVKRDGL